MLDAEKLIRAAVDARKKAYAPYSGFSVGAAVLADDGRIFSGCNVENASYGATLCAERVAAAKAVSEGAQSFKAVAVAGGPIGDTRGESSACPPCGICRQVLYEFGGGDLLVVTASKNGLECRTMAELLPEAFGPEKL